MSTTTAKTLAAALAYQAHGWHCFVLSASKVPFRNCTPCGEADNSHDPEACSCLTCHGFYAATLDPNRLAQMLAARPDGLLAVRTGAPSGIVALDIDERDNGTASLARLEAAIGVLPGTVMQGTPGGAHMLYKHPGHRVRSGSKLLGADMTGLDVKGDGGYILVAPSERRDGGRYSWFGGIWQWGDMPTWPAALDRIMQPPVLAPRPAHLRAASQQGTTSRAQAYAAAALRGECEAVASMPVDSGRNDRLNRAALKLGHYVEAGQLDRDHVINELTEAAQACGLPSGEIGDGYTRGTIASGLRAAARQPRPTGGAA